MLKFLIVCSALATAGPLSAQSMPTRAGSQAAGTTSNTAGAMSPGAGQTAVVPPAAGAPIAAGSDPYATSDPNAVRTFGTSYARQDTAGGDGGSSRGARVGRRVGDSLASRAGARWGGGSDVQVVDRSQAIDPRDALVARENAFSSLNPPN